MRWRGFIAMFVVALASTGAAPPASLDSMQDGSQPPAFTSRVDAVRVDVLVTQDGRIVRGLQPADFEVFDNGVPQQVDLVTFERLPLKLVLAFDVSSSVAGERLQQLRRAGAALVEQLSDADESGFMTFSHVVTLRAPLGKDRARMRAALESAEASGGTALVDAVYASLVLGEAGAGRALLIVFSDGTDTSSWLRPDLVLETARRSDAVVYCVSTAPDSRGEFAAEIATLTGGAFLQVQSANDLRPTFLRILEEFRQRYLVSYTPRGVAAGGWHRLDVRIKGRRATVRARPGYSAGQDAKGKV